jgi:hypothetical protein
MTRLARPLRIGHRLAMMVRHRGELMTTARRVYHLSAEAGPRVSTVL